MKTLFYTFALTILLASCSKPAEPVGDALDHTPDQEGYYYQRITLPIPEDIVLEVGGLDIMNDGRAAISTRRGEIWLVDDAYGQNPTPTYNRFAQGLHEPLGLLAHDGAIYAAQRGELTKLIDENGDDQADVYKTVASWPLTGNYHEYSYGPLLLPNGNFFVSLNVGWFSRGESRAKWRGWALEISPEGEILPMAVGFRSPAGIGITSSGDVFYGENQGDWIGSGWISHIEKGDFLGHPSGLAWTNEPGSPLKLTADEVPDTGEPMINAAETVEALKLPAVWFPHTIMGISTSAIIEDNTNGAFGPFAGHLFVGDQGHSKLMRVYLEKVDGAYQGANFPFYEGFTSGILRAAWGKDQSLFVGQTSRGWAATGKAPFALERLAWTGKMPFEMKEIHVKPDGFEITFTKPADPASAADPALYTITSFTYKYHSTYGSPAININELTVQDVVVSDDGLRARVYLDGLRPGYIHEFRLGALKAQDGADLLHDFAYYTLNRIPSGETTASSTPNQEQAASSTSAASKRVTTMPASWSGKADHSVKIGTLPGLIFDQEAFEVKAGSKVALTFDNNDDMMHNLIVTSMDGLDLVIEAAQNLGLRGQEMGYAPPGDKLLFHTGLLEPETIETIYFIAPDKPGAYPFVCTFPGHSMTMRGVMIVSD